MRKARARTSGEYRPDVFVMAPPSQGSEPPANPARFILLLGLHLGPQAGNRIIGEHLVDRVFRVPVT